MSQSQALPKLVNPGSTSRHMAGAPLEASATLGSRGPRCSSLFWGASTCSLGCPQGRASLPCRTPGGGVGEASQQAKKVSGLSGRDQGWPHPPPRV